MKGWHFLLAWCAALGCLVWPSAYAADKPQRLRAALFVNGTLGDKSFYDSAAAGLRAAVRSENIFARVVEGGVDPSRWEPALADLVDSEEFDVIVVGTFTMVPLVEKLSMQYPAARFVMFDASVDYARCRCSNVYSMLFRQSEGAYLAGYLASRLGESANTAPGGALLLGVVGGMQIPVVDDFIVGFIAGAQAAAPRASVKRQYVNSFSDPATAKEMSKALFGQGVSLMFHVAGASGQGVIEAAVEARRLAIGVDSDQYGVYAKSNPEKAKVIMASVLKRVDVAVERAVRLHKAGALPYGRSESLGLAEGGISLLRSPHVPAGPGGIWTAEIDALTARIKAGEVRVPSLFGRAAK